jgi:transcriptional regulator with XRE-family HTH domain
VRVDLKAPKPKAFQKPPQTLGEHLKARRLALELFQEDAARQMGVSAATVLNWEKDKGEPLPAFWPAVLAFLGYDPRPAPQTLGERLTARRHALGWSIEKAAVALDVDPSTFGDWERGKIVLVRVHRKRLAQFLGIEEAALSEDMARAWGNAHMHRRHWPARHG